MKTYTYEIGHIVGLWVGFTVGVIFGIGAAICIVDDMDRFTLPLSGDTFERVTDSPPLPTK